MSARYRIWVRCRSTWVQSSGVGASRLIQPRPLRPVTRHPNGLPNQSCAAEAGKPSGDGGDNKARFKRDEEYSGQQPVAGEGSPAVGSSQALLAATLNPGRPREGHAAPGPTLCAK